jgi:GT2 family glycosyltransferase
MTGHLLTNKQGKSTPMRLFVTTKNISSISRFLTSFSGLDFNSLLKKIPDEVRGFSNYLEDEISEMTNLGIQKRMISEIAVTKTIAALSLWMGYSNSIRKPDGGNNINLNPKKSMRRKENIKDHFSTTVVIPLRMSQNVESIKNLLRLLSIVSTLDEIKSILLIGIVKSNPLKNLSGIKKVRAIIPTLDLGPAHARNIGIEEALEEGSKAILFLDDDVVLDNVKGLASILKRSVDERCIISPIVKSKGKTLFDFYHDFDGTLNGVYLSTERNELLYATTCCLIVPTEIFSHGVRFDTSFESAAGEDIDFCYNCRTLGYKIIPADDVTVGHNYGYLQAPESIIKFVNRYIRYGSGNRLVLSKHPNYYEDVSKSIPRRTSSIRSEGSYTPRNILRLAMAMEMMLK